MEPEWSDFKVLLALARAGSVAGAGRELRVDNSTISRRLAALEDAVGAKLIIRGGREFCLTAEGKTLLAAAESMASAAAQATREVLGAKSDMGGAVRISVVPALVPVLMRLMLPALREKHPGLAVELRGDYHRVDLAKAESDVAVRMAKPDEAGLVARRAFETSWYAYASKTYLDTHGRPGSPAALAQHRLVLYVEPMHSVAPFRWMEAHRGDARSVFRVDNVEIALQTITADGGIAVLPCFSADGNPSLERVFQDPVGTNTGWIVYHETLRGAARIRSVVDALVEVFERNESMFSGTRASQAKGQGRRRC